MDIYLLIKENYKVLSSLVDMLEKTPLDTYLLTELQDELNLFQRAKDEVFYSELRKSDLKESQTLARVNYIMHLMTLKLIQTLLTMEDSQRTITIFIFLA